MDWEPVGFMLEYPADLKYMTSHIWVRIDPDAGQAVMGITAALQEELPEILSVDLPLVGDELEMEHPCVHLHLPSGITALPSPLTGRAVAINREVLDTPSLLHLAPYENWLVRLEYDEPDEIEMLLDAKQYAAYVDSL